MQTENLTYKLLGTDGLLSSALDMDEKSLELFENHYVLDHYTHSQKRSDKQKNLEKLLDKSGYKNSSYAFLAYDAYQLLLYALNNCPEQDSICINSLLQNSDIVQGISENFSILNSKAKRGVYINKIKDAMLEKEVVVF